jgi:hypothetical protein
VAASLPLPSFTACKQFDCACRKVNDLDSCATQLLGVLSAQIALAGTACYLQNPSAGLLA